MPCVCCAAFHTCLQAYCSAASVSNEAAPLSVAQVVYKVYEYEDLKPLLEVVNAERQKEKDEES